MRITMTTTPTTTPIIVDLWDDLLVLESKVALEGLELSLPVAKVVVEEPEELPLELVPLGDEGKLVCEGGLVPLELEPAL